MRLPYLPSLLGLAAAVTATPLLNARSAEVNLETASLARAPENAPQRRSCFAEVDFTLTANTTYGENVWIVGISGPDAGWDELPVASYPEWSGILWLEAGSVFQYKYVVEEPNGWQVWEADPVRNITVPEDCGDSPSLYINDVWQNPTISPLTRTGNNTVAVTFNELVSTQWGQQVYLVGSIPALGSWRPIAGVPLTATNYTDANPLWSATIYLPPNTAFEYKYIIVNLDGTVVWEADPNQSYTVPSAYGNGTNVENDVWQ